MEPEKLCQAQANQRKLTNFFRKAPEPLQPPEEQAAADALATAASGVAVADGCARTEAVQQPA